MRNNEPNLRPIHRLANLISVPCTIPKSPQDPTIILTKQLGTQHEVRNQLRLGRRLGFLYGHGCRC